MYLFLSKALDKVFSIFSVLAEDAIKAALQDYKVKNQKTESSS